MVNPYDPRIPFIFITTAWAQSQDQCYTSDSIDLTFDRESGQLCPLLIPTRYTLPTSYIMQDLAVLG